MWYRVPPPKLISIGLKLLYRLNLLHIEVNPKGEIIECSNFTLLNLWLVWFGPMREDKLAAGVLIAQMACGLLGLLVRHRLALLVFREDNLMV